jgi:hypothetical protein
MRPEHGNDGIVYDYDSGHPEVGVEEFSCWALSSAGQRWHPVMICIIPSNIT